MGPCVGPFVLVAVAVWRLLLCTWTAVLLYHFMAGGGWNCMTCCDSGPNLHVRPCCQPKLLGEGRQGLDREPMLALRGTLALGGAAAPGTGV
jgi:hypothetical protein